MANNGLDTSEKGLPNSWKSVTLKDVGEIITGNTPPRKDRDNYGDAYPWVKPADLDRNTKIKKTDEYLSTKGANKARILPINSVLVSCIGNLGKIGIAGTELATNQQINSIIFNKKVVFYKYGYFYCRTLERWMEEKASATTVTIINKSRFSDAPFLLPPLNEQCRIVAKLEKLSQKVDACKERLDKIPPILKRFRQSVLTAACSGRLTADWREKNPETGPVAGMLSRIKDKGVIGDTANSYDLYELPKNWSWLRIIDIGDVKGGKRLPKGEKLVRINTGFPYIKAGFLKEGTVVTDNLEYLTPEVREKIKRYTVTDGDVYITIVGACIGDAGVIPKKLDGANLTENAAKICNTEGVNNHYLANWLRSTVCQDFIKRTILSAAQGKLALGRIKMLPVPIPLLNEQQEIVYRVEALFKIADQIEERYKKGRAYVDKLTQSILAKAFRGELVPQDPNDEPASELLKKIKDERNYDEEKSKKIDSAKKNFKNRDKLHVRDK